MSGIAGYWCYATHDIRTTIFANFVGSLAHRGPDGSGINHFPNVRLWLGHRRLNVADRFTDARQPVADPQNRFWLTFDGAIYNSWELRDALRAPGRGFALDSVGAVILAAYSQWGEECFQRFNGIWAAAIWDSHERQLLLARDNFGVKPLHYVQQNGTIAFASELKAFLRLPWINGAFDPKVVATVLDNVDDQEATALTLLPGVLRVLPGHAITIAASGEIRCRRWWNLLDYLPVPPAELSQQVAEFKRLFLNACALSSCTHAPLAVEQSGGLDSSAIACSIAALARLGDGPQRDQRPSFICCLNDARHDEYNCARIAAEHAGMPLHRVNVDDRQALEVIDRVIFDHEIVFGFPRIGAWMLYRAMHANGIRISLSGIGADDILGCDCIEAELNAALRRLDIGRYREMRRVLRGTSGGNIQISSVTALAEIRRIVRALCATLRLLEPARRLLRRAPRTTFLRISGVELSRSAVESAQRSGLSQLDARRYNDLLFATPLYLGNFDRAAAAHSIEPRFPFMEKNLVAYAFALPDRSRNGEGYTKHILRLATERLVPDGVRLRTQKTAFTVPLDYWARGALKPWVLDLCGSRGFLESETWYGPQVRQVVEDAVAGQGSLYPVWPLLQCYALQQSFARCAAESILLAEAKPDCEVVTVP